MPKQIVHIGHIIHQVHQSYHNKTNKKLCCHKEAARCFVSDTVCIASIQNVERSLLLIVVSASDIPLHTIKFFSVVFSSTYSSMLQAVTNKHSLVRRRLCDLHCMIIGNCFCHFVVRTCSSRSIASGACVADCVIYSASSSANVFDTSHVQQSSIASY